MSSLYIYAGCTDADVGEMPLLATPTLEELLDQIRLEPSFSSLHIEKKTLVYEFRPGGFA